MGLFIGQLLTSTMKKKENRGGARPGAGRPKTKEDTVVIRVPVSLVPKIKAMIAKHATSQRLK